MHIAPLQQVNALPHRSIVLHHSFVHCQQPLLGHRGKLMACTFFHMWATKGHALEDFCTPWANQWTTRHLGPISGPHAPASQRLEHTPPVKYSHLPECISSKSASCSLDRFCAIPKTRGCSLCILHTRNALRCRTLHRSSINCALTLFSRPFRAAKKGAGLRCFAARMPLSMRGRF